MSPRPTADEADFEELLALSLIVRGYTFDEVEQMVEADA